MKKFTFLMIALFIAAMGFAQTKQVVAPTFKAAAKKALVYKTTRAVTGTLQLSGTEEYTGIGTDGAGTFAAAARFEATALTSYVGQYITKISVDIQDASTVTAGKVAVLTGTIDAPVVATEQACTFETGLNEVSLLVPYQIPAETAIMIAYEVTVTGGYPIGCDEGPVVEGANLINMEGITGAFSPLTDLAETLTYNFIIAATVEDEISTDPIMVVSPSEMSFVGLVGDASTPAQTATIIAANLTGDITVTTAAPFEVSADNTAFGATATMTEGGNFYVRYIPADAEALNVTGTVTVATAGVDNQTIALTAITYDCTAAITSFPYEEGFENGIPQCWTLIDADGDGHNWMAITDLISSDASEYVHGGANAAISESYNNSLGALNANNWMITQAIELPSEGAYLAGWYATSLDSDYPDSYSVYIGTEPTVAGMTANAAVLSHTANEGDWTLKTIDLSAFAGQTIYIGFNHVGNDNYVLMIDDFSVFAAPSIPEIELTSISIADEATLIAGNITLSGVVTNNGSTLTSYTVSYTVDGGTAVEYNVSEINVTWGNTHNFTHATPIALEAGEHTIVVTVSNPNGVADDNTDNSITVNVTAIDCDVISVPYTQDFENELGPCWITMANNEDNATELGVYDNNGNGVFRFSSYNEADNQYLITPELALTEDAILSFEYAVRSAYYPETFRVMTSTTDNNVASFTALGENVTAEETTFNTYIVTIPAATKYIAINYIAESDNWWLYIDNLTLRAVPTNAEIALTSVAPETGTTVQTGQNINISGVVTNNGVALTSYKVAYTVDNGEAVEYDVTGINVALGETHNFTHATPVVLETAGEHTIVVTVSNPNGSEDGESDNSMTITINAISCDPITTFPYTEDFENGINQCWTLIDADGDGYNWMHSSERFGETWEGHSGTGALVSASYASAALTPDNWAITPAITLPESSPASVSFFAAAQDSAYPAEHYGVYVSTTTTDPSAFTLIWDETMDANGGQHRVQGAWGEKHADLSNYAGQTIYIAFRHFNCSDEFVFLIDDVTVALVSAAEENIAEAISVYPNPTSSMVTIANAEGKDIIVVNSLGQVVASIENAAANQTIDVSNFANGTYFVKIDAEVVKLNVVK